MHKRLVIVAILFCLLVRGGFLLVAPEPFQKDIDAYRAIALCLQQTGQYGLLPAVPVESSDLEGKAEAAPENALASLGPPKLGPPKLGPPKLGPPKPTAFRPPLYPAVLSLLVKDGALSVFAVACLHLTMAVLTVVAIFFAMKTVTGHAGLSLAAAMMVSLDPILLQQSSLVMTETMAAMLVAIVIFLWSQLTSKQKTPGLIGPLAVGCILGLAYLCRPTFLVWAALLISAFWVLCWRGQNTSGQVAWRGFLAGDVLVKPVVMGLPVLVILAAWTARNQWVLDAPVWATTHGGYTILLANNESFYDYVDASPARAVLGPPWDAEPFLDAYQHRFVGQMRAAQFWETDWQQTPLETPAFIDEVTDDQDCNQAAKATIRRRPVTFVTSAVVRAMRLWSPLPLKRPPGFSIKIAGVVVWYLVVYALVLYAIVRHRKALFQRQWIAVWLLCLTLTAVHAVYWSNLRMRGPAMPALCMVACMAFLPARRAQTSPMDSSQPASPG